MLRTAAPAGRQRNPLYSNSLSNGESPRTGVARTDRNEGVVAFKNISVWLAISTDPAGRLLEVLHCVTRTGDHSGVEPAPITTRAA